MKTDMNELMQSITDGIVLYDNEGKETFMNNKANDFLRASDKDSWLSNKVEDEVGRICSDKMSTPITFELSGKANSSGIICTVLNFENGYAAIVNDRADQVQQEVFVDNILMLSNHELRTPMNGFIGAVQLAAELFSTEGKTGSGELEKIVDIALRTGQMITSKLQKLLELSRLFSVESIVSDKKIDPQDLVLAAYDKVLPYAADKLVSIEFQGFENPLGTVVGSRSSLSMAVNEFLMNAIEYSDSNTGIILQAKQQGEYFQLSIRDHGNSLNPGIGHAMFEAFRTGDKRAIQCEKGLGIGISLSKRIIELHGGTIRVNSDWDSGSEFIIELPAGFPYKSPLNLQKKQAPQYAEDIALLMSWDTHCVNA